MHKCFFCKQGKYFSEWSTKGALLILGIFMLGLFSIGFHIQSYKEQKQIQENINSLCKEIWEKPRPTLSQLTNKLKEPYTYTPATMEEKISIFCSKYG